MFNLSRTSHDFHTILELKDVYKEVTVKTTYLEEFVRDFYQVHGIDYLKFVETQMKNILISLDAEKIYKSVIEIDVIVTKYMNEEGIVTFEFKTRII